MSTKTVRNIREPLKKPRPLKSVGSSDQIKFHIQDPKDSVIQKSKEEILADLEILNVSISNCNFDEVTAADISRMCAILKKRGEELDKFNKDAIDRYFCTLRNASREERLDMVSRLKLLETIEIRANSWKKNDNINNYFNSKISDLEQGLHDVSITTSASMTSVPYTLQNQNSAIINTVPLAPGEILRSSGKFSKPTKITGKNFFKDEIIIRNSDSGKVNPGARDRLVQITGPDEEAIGHAKLLVEDTIRRNASPIRETSDMILPDNSKDNLEYNSSYSNADNQLFMKKNLQHSYSMSDATLREHNVSVRVNNDVIRLSGTNAELLNTAQLVLTEFFAGQTKALEKQHEHLSSLNKQLSPERNKHSLFRYELQKQFTVPSNMDKLYSSGWMNHVSKRESISPLSSSDDDFVKDDRKNEIKQNLNITIHEPTYPSTEIKRRAISLGSSNIQGEIFRRSSVPNDFSVQMYPEISTPGTEEVFSPTLSPSDCEFIPIQPPTYKNRRYSRETLLNLANSPFSHNQPADYAHIHQNFQEIICQSPKMFDPQKFKEKDCKLDEP